MKRAALLCPVVFAWLAHAPATTEACTSDVEPRFPLVAPMPIMGTVAPTNTRIWIPAPSEPDQLRVTVNGSDITFDPVGIEVATERGVMFMLIPQAPLPVGANVVVSQRTTMLTQFTVGAGPDDTPPPEPAIEHIDIQSGYFGLWSCGDESRVTLRTEYDADLLILDEQHGTALSGHALGLSAFPEPFVSAVDLSEGEHDLRLLAVDQAGNMTVMPVPQVTVPALQQGCSTTRPTGWAWMLGVLAVVVRRRRRQSDFAG